MADFPDSTTVPEITRPMIESEIERLISILDILDPDPDLEDNGDGEPGGDDEPLYGWTEMGARFGRYGFGIFEPDELEFDDADDEPELGSLEQLNQTRWAKGRDGEPSLGSTHNFGQECWGLWAGDDREEQCEDEGAQSEDEGCGNGNSTPNYCGPCGPISLKRTGG